eukprot:1341412-Lingulodinium_polyedra.AAC.1
MLSWARGQVVPVKRKAPSGQDTEHSKKLRVDGRAVAPPGPSAADKPNKSESVVKCKDILGAEPYAGVSLSVATWGADHEENSPSRTEAG